MNCLTKVGLALLVVFVVFLLAFAAELVFVLHRRRRPRRAFPAPVDPELASPAAAAGPRRSTPTPKHVLLRFLFCFQNGSRVEPASSSSAATAAVPLFSLAKAPTFPGAAETELELELARWRSLYASRVLFTIREEEKEGVDSEDGGRTADAQRSGEEQEEAEVEVTPFSTPCASPPFYTPPPSPTRGVEAGEDGSESHGGEVLPSSEKKRQRVE